MHANLLVCLKVVSQKFGKRGDFTGLRPEARYVAFNWETMNWHWQRLGMEVRCRIAVGPLQFTNWDDEKQWWTILWLRSVRIGIPIPELKTALASLKVRIITRTQVLGGFASSANQQQPPIRSRSTDKPSETHQKNPWLTNPAGGTSQSFVARLAESTFSCGHCPQGRSSQVGPCCVCTVTINADLRTSKLWAKVWSLRNHHLSQMTTWLRCLLNDRYQR